MSDHDPYGEPTRVDVPASDPTMAMPAATGGVPPVAPPPLGEPPDEPPDRRPWILAGLAALVLLVLLVLFLVGDDDDDDAPATTTTVSTTSSTTTTSTTTTTTAPTTTTTAAPTTTTTATPTSVDPARCTSSPPEDPRPTAQVVYDAYAVGDRGCASNVMTSDALDALFDIPGGGAGWQLMGCEDVEDPDPQTWCSFAFEGGSTTFRMAYGEAEGWTVFGVFQTAD